MLPRTGLYCAEMRSFYPVSVFRDFYTIVAPVPRAVIAYTRQELFSHDIASVTGRKPVLPHALFTVIKKAGISAFTRGCRAGRNKQHPIRQITGHRPSAALVWRQCGVNCTNLASIKADHQATVSAVTASAAKASAATVSATSAATASAASAATTSAASAGTASAASAATASAATVLTHTAISVKVTPGRTALPAPSNYLRAAVLNTRSACELDKCQQIKDLITENQLDICSLTETWFNPSHIAVKAVVPPGYTMKHIHRANARGGGVAIIFRDTISVTVSKHNTYTSMEYLNCLFKRTIANRNDIQTSTKSKIAKRSSISEGVCRSP